MKKKILVLCFIFVFIQTLFVKAFPYENIGGRYGYNTYKDYNIAVNDFSEEVLLIVDYSNSMNGRMGYTSKLIMTQNTIKKILRETNPNIKIGLRIFGFSDSSYITDNINSLYEKEICSATKLVVPVSANNNNNITNAMNNFSSRGASPIGLSLRQALSYDFSASAKIKHIILITDGAETCGDDPCSFIRTVMRQRNDIKIDVIGITLKENQFSQLKCLADYGRGQIYNIENAGDFDYVFNQTIKFFKPQNKPAYKKQQYYNPYAFAVKYKNYMLEFKN